MSDDLSGFSLMELFRTKAESQTAVLSSGLLALEVAEATAAMIEPLMRAAHSLKGVARIVGMAAAERVAHAVEYVFVAVQKGKTRLEPHHVDFLLTCVDLLSEVSQMAEGEVERWQAENAGRIDETVAALQEIRAGTLPAQPKEAAPTVAVPIGSEAAPPPVPAEEEPPPEVAEGPPAPAPAPPGPESLVATAPPVPAPPEPPLPPRVAPAAESQDRVVRVTADNLNRLMGLAGESLVEARLLRSIVDSLLTLKSIHSELWDGLQELENHYTSSAAWRLAASGRCSAGSRSRPPGVWRGWAGGSSGSRATRGAARTCPSGSNTR